MAGKIGKALTGWSPACVFGLALLLNWSESPWYYALFLAAFGGFVMQVFAMLLFVAVVHFLQGKVDGEGLSHTTDFGHMHMVAPLLLAALMFGCAKVQSARHAVALEDCMTMAQEQDESWSPVALLKWCESDGVAAMDADSDWQYE